MSSKSPLVRWPLSVAAFLLGMVGVIWWQIRSDQRLLEQMEDPQGRDE
jgi:hypothetical protein